MKIPYICCLMLITAWAQSTRAGVILDQEYLVDPSRSWSNYYLDFPGDYLQQTFTVRHSGKLVGIGVQVSLHPYPYPWYPSEPPIDDLHLKVVRTDADGFALIDEVLAEATIPPSRLISLDHDLPGPITDVDLTSWHASVLKGEKLAITFSSNQTDHSGPKYGTNYQWFRNYHNPHPGGEYSTYSPKYYGAKPLRDIWLGGGDPTVDAGFRVYVDIPEPSSLLILLSCVAFGAVSRGESRILP